MTYVAINPPITIEAQKLIDASGIRLEYFLSFIEDKKLEVLPSKVVQRLIEIYRRQ